MDWLHLPDVAINLANLHLAQRQIPAAIQLYTTTLQKHYKNNATIMLYLARALYDAGRNSQAKRTLLKAIHLQPTQMLLRFNSAVTMQVRVDALAALCTQSLVPFNSAVITQAA